MDDKQALHKELMAATLRAAHRVAKECADEGLYCFALYHSGEYRDAFTSVSTRTGLAQVAERYLTREPFARAWVDLPTTMQQLKWSPCDSPRHLVHHDEFKAANELLDALWEDVDANEDLDDEDFDDEDMDDDYNRLCRFVHGAFIDALQEVRAAGIFNGQVTLNVLTGDQGNDERLETAALLNDAPAVQRLRDDLASYIPVVP